jgi:ribonucleoside-diphosphate reductase alpha chain
MKPLEHVSNMDALQQFIHKSRYARWRDDLNRREHWHETVERYMSMWEEFIPTSDPMYNTLFNAIYDLHVMPSMRLLMTAGKAVKQNHISAYNCAYLAIDHPIAFDETLYILMHGTGVGFSVERQYISDLPTIPSILQPVDTTIIVEDSKEGWQSAYRQLISGLYAGVVYKWDTSRVRGKGERLKTFGGRSSGPQALIDLFNFTVALFNYAKGKKLTSLQCHSLMCKIAEIVVVGGVRRSALLSLSNLSDQRMRDAKSGQWWEENNHFALANNSVAYTEKPEVTQFMSEWLSLVQSKSGERGIFNRQAAKYLIPLRRKERGYIEYGCNPLNLLAA